MEQTYEEASYLNTADLSGHTWESTRWLERKSIRDERRCKPCKEEHGKIVSVHEQAEAFGWKPKKGNLAEVAPEKMIGGEIYKNQNRHLPDAPGRVWYEADLSYISGFRSDCDRILYSNDGLIFVTCDHYETFYEISERRI